MESLLEALSAALTAIIAFLIKKYREKHNAKTLLEIQVEELEHTIDELRDKNVELKLKIDHQVEEFEEKINGLKTKNDELQSKIQSQVEEFKTKVQNYDELLKKYTDLESLSNEYKKQLKELSESQLNEVINNEYKDLVHKLLQKK